MNINPITTLCFALHYCTAKYEPVTSTSLQNLDVLVNLLQKVLQQYFTATRLTLCKTDLTSLGFQYFLLDIPSNFSHIQSVPLT